MIRPSPAPDLSEVGAEDWEKARRRFEVLKPLADAEQRSRGMAQAAADELGVSLTLIYRLLARYEADPRLTSLLPERRGRREGQLVLPAEVDEIITSVINELFLTRQRQRVSDIVLEVRKRCRTLGFQAPSRKAIDLRVRLRPAAEVHRKRHGRKAARDRFAPAIGSLDAPWPLSLVQIDHTLVDVIVVDSRTREPIQRPWLTLAIDVHSRCVAGFHLSLDPPSATSVALCIAHAALPKSNWLMARDIEAEWPVSGIPERLHLDNAKEFRSEALKQGCHEHGVGIDYRPVRTPHYGAHIERLIGTMMGAVHLLPGSHFSNIFERGDLDAEAEAVMTLAELETWLALEITGSYHARIHSALETTPSAAWGLTAGQSRLRMPADLRQFLVDFLPSEQRVLQRDGFHLFHIRYWSNELRWLMARESRKYTLKYDPRDLSRIFVLTEDGIIEARPADLTRPAITLWEHRAARRALRESGRRSVDEELIFRTIEAQRDLVDSAARQTKAIRRHQARRAHLDPRPMIDVTPASEPPAALPASENKSNALKDHPGFYVEEWYDDD